MNIYRKNDTTYVDGEGDLVFSSKERGFNVDYRGMKNHFIQNFICINPKSMSLKSRIRCAFNIVFNKKLVI